MKTVRNKTSEIKPTSEKITLRTLAAELKVAPATVMRALSGHPNVRPELRKKIMNHAFRNGYRLPGRHTGNVAIITSGSCFSGYLSCLLLALFEELQRCGFHVFILPEPDVVSFSDVMYDGIISTTWVPGFEKKYPKEHSLPLVSVNTMDNRIDNVYMVSSDESGGVTMGLQYLYKSGCRKILFFPPASQDNLCSAERLCAFQEFCDVHNLPYKELIVRLPDDSKGILHAAKKALQLEPDGIFVPSEYLSCSVMNAFLRLGNRIPEQVSMLGLEDDLISGSLFPAMTTIRQDYEGLARESVSMLKKLIDGKKVTTSVRLPYKLIERETVRRHK